MDDAENRKRKTRRGGFFLEGASGRMIRLRLPCGPLLTQRCLAALGSNLQPLSSRSEKRKTRRGGFFLDGASGRMIRLRLPCGPLLTQRCLATLGSNLQPLSSRSEKRKTRLGGFFLDGASGRIRTSDRSVRSRVLYPAELRMHCLFFCFPDNQVRLEEWCIREDSNLRPLGS